ncbi:MAG TPA: DUF4352 domain-containing protein [Gaiellaceae bacterium]|nr:DUF4352 domain-containing protein [Gaiellaceae bacterium]
MAPRRCTPVAALAALALAAGGCGGGDEAAPLEEPRPTTTARSTPAPSVAAESEPPDASHEDEHAVDEAERLEPASLGETVALAAPGVTLEATASELVDPARGTADFTPQRDHRLVAIHVELRNTGGARYADTPSSGATVVTSGGDEHGAAIVAAALEPLERVELAPGESAGGFLTFEVPRGAELVELRLTPLSGFGRQTAVWRLARG